MLVRCEHGLERRPSAALSAAGLIVRFPLEKEPTSMSSITVTVDGQEVSQNLFDGWTYDAREVAIVFHGDSIPENGSTVNVSYEIPASCTN